MAQDTSHLVEQYERDGFIILRNVLDPRLMDECRRHVDFLMAKFPSIPPEQLHHPIMRNDPFWVRLVSDSRLLDLATLLGSSFMPCTGDVALFSSHYICKPPKTGKAVLWHQDGAYWPLKPMNVLSMWLAVDHSDTENGCLRVIRGSHKQNLVPLKDDNADGNVLGSFTHREEDIDQEKVVDIVLKPGDISIHHPNMVHSSKANTSDRRRCGLTIRYMAPATECLEQTQPVMMMRGKPVEGINHYRSWPKYRPGYDFPFDGCEEWNEKRCIVPDDEPFFNRTDYTQIDQEIEEEVLSFMDNISEKYTKPS